MIDTPVAEGRWRYTRGAVSAIFLPPLLIGVPIALGNLYEMGANALIIIPVALFYGAIIATPFVGAGTILFMLAARFTRPRWWHSAFIGALLIIVASWITNLPPRPLDQGKALTIVVPALFGALCGFIFWYFARPHQTETIFANSKENSDLLG